MSFTFVKTSCILIRFSFFLFKLVSHDCQNSAWTCAWNLNVLYALYKQMKRSICFDLKLSLRSHGTLHQTCFTYAFILFIYFTLLPLVKVYFCFDAAHITTAHFTIRYRKPLTMKEMRWEKRQWEMISKWKNLVQKSPVIVLSSVCNENEWDLSMTSNISY